MNGLRVAFRVAVRRWWWFVVATAAFVVTSHVLPLYVATAPERQGVSEVDTIGAEHDCEPVAGHGRTLLLIDSAAAGVRLVAAAVTADGARAQRDLFYDERVDFYGWCRP